MSPAREPATGSLRAQHRWFLLVDQAGGSSLVNLVLNAAIAWLLFRSLERVPLFGLSSVSLDTLATAFFLPAITCLLGSWIVTHRFARGRIPAPPPSSHAGIAQRLAVQPLLPRALLFGAAGVLLAALPVVLIFTWAGLSGLSFSAFFWFKTGFAAILAAVVTPLIGWSALLAAAGDDSSAGLSL